MNRQDHLLMALNAIGQLNSTREDNHSLRIKLASRVIDSMKDFLAAEVLEAVDKTKPHHMTWDEIGDTMNLSKSAVFSRYGKKRD